MNFTFNQFGELEQVSIWVLDHQVKLDGLKKYTLQCHHFLLLQNKTKQHICDK